jgi:hypothetical protein
MLKIIDITHWERLMNQPGKVMEAFIIEFSKPYLSSISREAR